MASRRKTLSEEIAELLDPTPSSSSTFAADEHPEDQAKIVDAELGEDEFDQNLLEAGGALRIRPDISLEDGVYAGKRSSRKELFEDRGSDEDDQNDEADAEVDENENDQDQSDDEEDFEDESEEEESESDQEKAEVLKKRKSSLTRSREDEEADRFELVAMKEAEQLQRQLDQMLSEQKSVVTRLVREEGLFINPLACLCCDLFSRINTRTTRERTGESKTHV